MTITREEVAAMSDHDLQQRLRALEGEVATRQSSRRTVLSTEWREATKFLAREATNNGYSASYIDEALEAQNYMPREAHPWLPSRPIQRITGMYIVRLGWERRVESLDVSEDPPLPSLSDMVTYRDWNHLGVRAFDVAVTSRLDQYEALECRSTTYPPSAETVYDLTQD